MGSTDRVEPMTDRRLVLAVLGVLTAALGTAVVLLSVLALRHPVGSVGDIGTPTDQTGQLVATACLGGALLVGGAAAAIGLVRAQLRRPSDRRPSS